MAVAPAGRRSPIPPAISARSRGELTTKALSAVPLWREQLQLRRHWMWLGQHLRRRSAPVCWRLAAAAAAVTASAPIARSMASTMPQAGLGVAPTSSSSAAAAAPGSGSNRGQERRRDVFAVDFLLRKGDVRPQVQVAPLPVEVQALAAAEADKLEVIRAGVLQRGRRQLRRLFRRGHWRWRRRKCSHNLHRHLSPSPSSSSRGSQASSSQPLSK